VLRYVAQFDAQPDGATEAAALAGLRRLDAADRHAARLRGRLGARESTGDPATALRDYHDYIQYVQSTQGHLNGGEGLCFVKRN
jgi:hypothetical protein